MLPFVAPLEDRRAVDEFHRQPRLSGVRQSAIDQSRDAGMLEACENLSFSAEAAMDRRGITPTADDLQRDRLLELSVGTLAEIDGSHSSLPDLSDHAIRTDRRPRFQPGVGTVVKRAVSEQRFERSLEEVVGILVGTEERLDLGAQRVIRR